MNTHSYHILEFGFTGNNAYICISICLTLMPMLNYPSRGSKECVINY